MIGTIKRDSKVTFNKAGSGSVSGRVTIPVEILELMGITKDSREIEICYSSGRIIITKKNIPSS